MNTTSNNIAGAAPAAVAPQGVVAWMHPETLDVIHADRKHEWATRYGIGGHSRAEGYTVALVRAGEPAAASPALEAPSAYNSAGPIKRYMLDCNIDGMDQFREFILATDHDTLVHDVLANADPAGTVQENGLLRDQVRQLDAMVGRMKREAVAPQAPAAPSDPMDWPLPCDVTVGHGTIRKGCKLRTLVLRMQVLYDLSRKVELAAPASESPAQAPHNLTVSEAVAEFREVCEAARSARAAKAAPAAPVEFQQRVQPWLMECFGPVISADKQERNHRFLEEALETVQAAGCTASEAHQLVDYVFGRPVGELGQEVGGTMVTLAALCLAHGVDMHAEAEKELARIWTKVEAIRAKQAAKPKHSPLLAAPAAPAVDARAERDAAFEAVRNRLCALQRYSFVLDDDGVVRRAKDRTGSWIEFDDAHALFDPVAVDAAIAAQAAAKWASES
ncbi:hypothetical protein [Delftia tsuruhatensis]|uniref:hypothetical protein n=2 Tax=Delftia tsuruhatensis TaxID=180282 RepID=UPI000AA958C4|nr:hypothetical protein [Delftia tsuruhatensis]